MLFTAPVNWGSVADWVSGIGSLSAVAAALYLAGRETRVQRKRESDEKDGFIDFAADILGPLRIYADKAERLQLEIEAAVNKDKNDEERSITEVAFAQPLRNEIAFEIDKWSKVARIQKRKFELLNRVISVRDARLATILLRMSDLFERTDTNPMLFEIKSINKEAEDLNQQLAGLRSRPAPRHMPGDE